MPAPSVKRQPPAPVRLGSVIGRSLTIDGEVQFEGAIRIDGTVRGAVSTPVDGEGALFIGAEGRVLGDVRATDVTVEGQVDGAVFATGKVAVGAHGRVSGEVHCGAIELAPGATLLGPLIPAAAEPVDGTDHHPGRAS